MEGRVITGGVPGWVVHVEFTAANSMWFRELDGWEATIIACRVSGDCIVFPYSYAT